MSELPVSVIVPHMKSRSWFFEDYALPLLRANSPKEIIVIDRDGHANEKRNEGFLKSTQPYVLFADDDYLIPARFIETLLEALEKNPSASYAYTGLVGVNLPLDLQRLFGAGYTLKSQEFDAQALAQRNYITTPALIRREAFVPFDPAINRLQDWDFFLTLLRNGSQGVYVPDAFFFSFHIDDGISIRVDYDRAVDAVMRKHRR